MSCASRPLARFIAAELGRGFHGLVAVVPVSSTDWASFCFSGARHRLNVVIEGTGAAKAAADFLERVNDIEMRIDGHVVADVDLVTAAERDGGEHVELELEALTFNMAGGAGR